MSAIRRTEEDIIHALEAGGNVCFLVISEMGNIEFIASVLASGLKYERNVLIGTHISKILAEDWRAFINMKSKATFLSGNGSLVYANLSCQSFKGDNSVTYYLLVAVLNESSKSSFDHLVEYVERLEDANSEIKEKSQTIEYLENHIIEYEMWLKLALNAVNDGVWDWNVKTNAVYFSDRFFTMLGYDAFEFPHNLETWNFMLENDGIDIKNMLYELVNENKNEFSFEYKLKKKNYGFAWILCRGLIVERDSKSEPSRILGTHVDISQLKEAETRLRTSEMKLKRQIGEYAVINKKLTESIKRTELLNHQLQDKQVYLNSILKTVPASITLISDQIILFANNYTSLMTGFDPEEILGHHIDILFDVPDHKSRLNSNFFNSSNPGVSKSVTTVWKLKGGGYIDVYLTATSLDSDIAPNAFTISVTDISAQRLYEDELIKAKEQAERAEKLKMVFLSNISHELRTPMNGIIGFAEMLRETSQPAKRDEYLKVIINSSKQLMRIITDLMEISKIETGELETFYSSVDLRAFFKEIYDSCLIQLQQRNKENIELSLVLPRNEMSAEINIDEVKLRYIINCLLMNAIKFTEKGSIKFGYEREGDRLHFFVSDTGIGIEEEEKEIIFESFRQSESPVRKKFGGNGLGLAIARGFSDVLGGKIRVESNVGEGATFYVDLPYRHVENAKPMVEETRDYFWDRYHILVVEDDFTCFTLIEELLEGTGIKISHAMTGLEAVKLCRKEADINIILMDMRLPEMDGYEATKRIKETRPDLAIIAQTAHALSEDRKKCINAGCNDYITKPIEQEKLLSLINKYLEISGLS